VGLKGKSKPEAMLFHMKNSTVDSAAPLEISLDSFRNFGLGRGRWEKNVRIGWKHVTYS
jgi:hypothetical protein